MRSSSSKATAGVSSLLDGTHVFWVFASAGIMSAMSIFGIISCNKFNIDPSTTSSIIPSGLNTSASPPAPALGPLTKWSLSRALSRGWIPGRMQDTSDEQWGKLKPFALPLIIGMFAHCAVGRAVSRSVAEGAKERALVVWQAAAGVAFCVFLHGPRAIWAVAVCVLNYGVCVFLGRRLLWQQQHALPCAAWVLNISLLLLCNLYDGFAYVPFASWAGAAGAALDRLVGDGAYNWQIQFNLTFLRLISFCMDRFWSLSPTDQPQPQLASARPVKYSNGGGGKIIGLSGVVSDSPDAERTEELRADIALPPHKYSLLHMLAYVFYIPLYIAGPIVPFNTFASIRHALVSSSLPHLARHATMSQSVPHTASMYYVIISENGPSTSRGLFESMHPVEVFWGGYFVLNFMCGISCTPRCRLTRSNALRMYLKFTAIWRFFRVWALMDGVYAGENMKRCVNNNFSFEGFWRQWHATLNKWIIRYMYIPLGGRRTQLWSMWIIFTFVGLWHDLWWRWLAWAWINCVCFSVEITVKKLFKLRAEQGRERGGWASVLRGSRYYRLAVALAASFNILCLITANCAIMFGFRGSYDFLYHSFVKAGGGTSLALCVLFYSALNMCDPCKRL